MIKEMMSKILKDLLANPIIAIFAAIFIHVYISDTLAISLLTFTLLVLIQISFFNPTFAEMFQVIAVLAFAIGLAMILYSDSLYLNTIKFSVILDKISAAICFFVIIGIHKRREIFWRLFTKITGCLLAFVESVMTVEFLHGWLKISINTTLIIVEVFYVILTLCVLLLSLVDIEEEQDTLSEEKDNHC